MLLTIIIFIAVLSLLVFAHELGHFWVSRLFGVKAEEFGFGLPPRIVGVVKDDAGKWRVVGGKDEAVFKRTIYSLNWIPVGGFVKIKGESGEAQGDNDSFSTRKIWQRALMLSAGVIMNVVLAAGILSLGFMLGLPSVVDDEPPTGAIVRDREIQILSVLKDSPAAAAGLASGDVIQKIDGRDFTTTAEVQEYVSGRENQETEFIFNRQGTELVKKITPVKLAETPHGGGIGIGLADVGLVSYPFHVAIWRGTQSAVFLTGEVIIAFGELIKNLVVKQEVAVDLSGPVGIAVLTGRAVRMGITYLLQFTAFLSINLAVVNFLPFPALDGGRVFFLILEKIRRRPVSVRLESLIHNIGFALLMVLVVLITYRDLVRASGQIIGGLKKLIGV
ncbi:MAG: RIP metalloprotease RseP [Patescibacteria group bacterium]|nr:RIP metalloprotease RseP [Patescibacteria group bacterium]